MSRQGSGPRQAIIVDTNVLMVAEGRHQDASVSCTQRCQRRLLEIQRSGRVVIDDQYRILGEYGRQFLDRRRQPGVGQAFFKWLHNNQGVAERCERVELTEVEGEEHTFVEYPGDPAPSDFDPPDRKFIAVAAAHAQRPPIAQALDSKWWGAREAFTAVGLTIEFLCEEEIASAYAKKFP